MVPSGSHYVLAAIRVIYQWIKVLLFVDGSWNTVEHIFKGENSLNFTKIIKLVHDSGNRATHCPVFVSKEVKNDGKGSTDEDRRNALPGLCQTDPG